MFMDSVEPVKGLDPLSSGNSDSTASARHPPYAVPSRGPLLRCCYYPLVARRGSDNGIGPDDAGDAPARRLTRRQVLGAGLAGGAGLVLAACSGSGTVNRAASTRPSGKDLEA